MSQKKINTPDYNSSFYTKAIELTIIALAVLVPIIFNPRCHPFFAPAKEFTFEALTIIGLMFWALKMINREEIKFTSTSLNLPVLSFIAICTLSLIWSDTFFTSLKELPHFLAGPLLYFVIVNNIRDEKQINCIISTVLLVGVASSIYGIFQYNDIDFSFWVGNVGRMRVFGLIGNVGYFAGYLLFPLSIAIPLFFVSKNRNRKILFLIGILTMGTAFILTFTRSSYLALGVSLIFMFFLFLLSRGKRFIKENKKIFIFLLIVIILAVSIFIIPNPLNKPDSVISQIKERVSLKTLKNVFSSSGRIIIWKFTGIMIKDRPIIGSGIGTYKYNTLRYQAKFFEQGDNRSIYSYSWADKAHNEYLQLWAELGIIGLAIFIWLIITYFNYGIRYLKREKDKQKKGIIIGLMGAVVAFLIDSIFWFPLHLSANLSLFWLFIGLAIVMIIDESRGLKAGEKIEIAQKDYDKEERRKKKKTKKRSGLKENNIHRLKPILYVVIILLAIFLCITLSRPFIARIVWYSGFKEVENRNWKKVTEIYEVALKWDPYIGGLYYDLGKIFMIRELYNTSLNYFKKAEKYIVVPDLPQKFAMLYFIKGETDKAIIELKKAISYQPTERKMAPLYFELGNAYLKLKKYELAETAFKDTIDILKKAISYQPTERKMAPLYFELGNAYLKLKKYELTEIAFKNAIGINYNLLTDDSLKQNRTDEELVELKNKINSNLVDAHHGLAGVYLRQNKIEEGLVELKNVIELAPDSEEAKYARDEIQKIEQTKPESQPTETDN